MDRNKITFQTYNKIAQIYQDKFMDMDLYNDTYDLFCSLITQKEARIFEIACGPGNITRYLAHHRPDFRIEATDIVPNMLELAKVNVPTASFSLMDCREIDQVQPGFDGIICGFGLPYLSQEEAAKLIKDCSFLLNEGGTIYLSVVTGDYSQSGYQTGSNGDQVYFYYHPENDLLEQLKTNHFEIVTVLKIDYPGKGGGVQVHTVFIARKKQTILP